MADDFYTRHDSLRLRGFDYHARRIYFVTIVVQNRREVFLDAHLAEATIACLKERREQCRFNVYTYCLMPDHLHVLLGPGASGLSLGEICGAFKSLTTRAYWQWHDGQLWQKRFHDHIVRNDEDFREIHEYIKLNPVRKGLVERWEDWPYTETIDRLSS